MSESETFYRTYRDALTLLTKDPDGRMVQLFQDVVTWDRDNPPQEPYDGFEWHEVHADPRTLNRLVTLRLLKIVYKSNSGTEYRVVDRGVFERALQDYDAMTEPLVSEGRTIPEDIFDIVVGHDDKKEILLRCLQSERPTHALLYGEVASAKTLFLECLMRLPGKEFCLGSSLTKAGIYDLLFSTNPRYLLIDELDKIDDQDNLAALLSLMHKGYLIETKHGRRRSKTFTTWVFASANETRRIPHVIMSRFIPLRFLPYTPNEFMEVATTILTEMEKIEEKTAIYISRMVLDGLNSRDVRDAVKVARLLTRGYSREEVDQVVGILGKQRS